MSNIKNVNLKIVMGVVRFMKREKINSIMDEFCEDDECRSKEHKEGLDKCAAEDEFELFHPVGF